MTASHLLLVAVGGALGSACRHLVGAAAQRWFGPAFPYGTFAVNLLGSMAMGLFVGWLAARGGDPRLRALVATGFLGGFTTFSAFSLDAVGLWERGATVAAAAYVGGTVLLSIGALVAGLTLARIFA